MKIRHPFIHQLGGLWGATAIQSWMGTLDYKAAFYDPAVDPVHRDYAGQKIYLFWHEYLLIPIYMRGYNNLSMLLSRHNDAEILSRAAHHLGFDFVRGSTSRGGVMALRELVRKSHRMNLTITPDGPRGPRRRLAQGPIYLSSKLRMPLVLMGFGCDAPWRFGSWDRFAVPRPFSRARAVVSPEIQIPARMDRGGIEHYRVEIERLLNCLTAAAEQWASSGCRHVRQTAVFREHARRPPYRRRDAPGAATRVLKRQGGDPNYGRAA